MADAVREYLKLKKDVEDAQQRVSKAEGSLESEMRSLKNKFGCSTLEEAEKMLKSEKKNKSELLESLEEEVEGYQEKWKGKD